MNDPITIVFGVVLWLFVVVCFSVGFGWTYRNPRKAWERGYHRQGLLRIFASSKDRDAKDGEPTEEELAEVRRRAMVGLVVALVLSPLIVAIGLLIGRARQEARFGGGMRRTWGNLYKVDEGMTVEQAQRIMGGPGNRGEGFGNERLCWDFVDDDGRHWMLCVDVKDGTVVKKYKTEIAPGGAGRRGQ